MIDRSLLDGVPATPSKPEESKPQVAPWSEVFDRIFVPLMKRLLSGMPMSPRELFNAAKLSELGYTHPNSLGTRLGHGNAGFKLHRANKVFSPVQENVKRLYDAASDEQIERLLSELSLDQQGFAQQVMSLPSRSGS